MEDDGCGLCSGWGKRWLEEPEGTGLPLEGQVIEPGVTVRFVAGRYPGYRRTVLNSLTPDRISIELRGAESGP